MSRRAIALNATASSPIGLIICNPTNHQHSTPIHLTLDTFASWEQKSASACIGVPNACACCFFLK
jgi:hypothetical protein